MTIIGASSGGDFFEVLALAARIRSGRTPRLDDDARQRTAKTFTSASARNLSWKHCWISDLADFLSASRSNQTSADEKGRIYYFVGCRATVLIAESAVRISHWTNQKDPRLVLTPSRVNPKRKFIIIRIDLLLISQTRVPQKFAILEKKT